MNHPFPTALHLSPHPCAPVNVLPDRGFLRIGIVYLLLLEVKGVPRLWPGTSLSMVEG